MLNTYDYLPTKPESPWLSGQGFVHCQKRPPPWEPEGCNPFPGLRTFKGITGEIFYGEFAESRLWQGRQRSYARAVMVGREGECPGTLRRNRKS